MSLEQILNHLNISPKYISPLPTTSLPVKHINNNTDDTGRLECGCYDTCHGVCYRFHRVRYTDNTLNTLERRQLLSNVEEIESFKCSEDVSSYVDCSHCSCAYPPAFLIYPNEFGAKYKALCIPCVVKFGLPNQKTIEILQQLYGPKKANIFIQHYYAIARTLVRHPSMPINSLLRYWTCATMSGYDLYEKQYYFDLITGIEEHL